MILRVLFAIGFVLVTTVQAWACSCAPWEGYVSDFSKNHVSVWAVPTNGTVNVEKAGHPIGSVTYTLEILEGYDRVTQTNIIAHSSIVNGGSCGIELTLGMPQFISVYDYGDEFYGLSSCTPKPPYDAVNRYLKTGQDSFIPNWSKCHSWPENEYNTPRFNIEIEDCAVWKDAGDYGNMERWQYNKIWEEKVESAEPKKKRRWWSFNKD